MSDEYIEPEIEFARAMLWGVLDLPYARLPAVIRSLASMAPHSEPLETAVHDITAATEAKAEVWRDLFASCGDTGQQLEYLFTAKPLSVFISAAKAVPEMTIPEGHRQLFASCLELAECVQRMLLRVLHDNVSRSVK